jgi:hypothetical protein
MNVCMVLATIIKQDQHVTRHGGVVARPGTERNVLSAMVISCLLSPSTSTHFDLMASPKQHSTAMEARGLFFEIRPQILLNLFRG